MTQALSPDRALIGPQPSRPLTATVATAYSRRGVGMGLDKPIDLLGGPALGADGTLARLDFGWAPTVRDALVHACLRRTAENAAWFGMKPLVLVGPAGAGGTHVARTIARAAGLPFAVINLADENVVRSLRPLSCPPDARLATPPVALLAATRCANPVVLLDGVCGASDAALEALSAMTDPLTSERWTDEAAEAVVDLSRISWIVRVQTPNDLPPALRSGIASAQIGLPTSQHDLDELILSLIAEVLEDGRIEPASIAARSEILPPHISELFRREGGNRRLDAKPISHLGVAQLHEITRRAIMRIVSD